MTAAEAISALAAWVTTKRDEAEKARDEARSVSWPARDADGSELYTAREARADAYQAVIVECARRVGELRDTADPAIAALRVALPILRECADVDSHYGSPMSDDPRDFHPDPECSTEEERARHKSLCDAWDRGERPEIPPYHQVAEINVQLADGSTVKQLGMVSMQPLGLGTTVFRNRAAEEACAAVEAVLGCMRPGRHGAPGRARSGRGAP